MIADISAAVAEEERRRLIKRVEAGVERAQNQGKWLGALPKGFERDDDGYLHVLLDPDQDFSTFLLTGDHYIKWLHMAPGGMFPVLKPVAKSEEWKNAPVLNVWGDTLVEVSNASANIDRFGVVNGKSFPALGRITDEFLIAEAVVRVTSGEDPAKVATEVAEEMREAVGK